MIVTQCVVYTRTIIFGYTRQIKTADNYAKQRDFATKRSRRSAVTLAPRNNPLSASRMMRSQLWKAESDKNRFRAYRSKCHFCNLIFNA